MAAAGLALVGVTRFADSNRLVPDGAATTGRQVAASAEIRDVSAPLLVALAPRLAVVARVLPAGAEGNGRSGDDDDQHGARPLRTFKAEVHFKTDKPSPIDPRSVARIAARLAAL